MLRRNRADYGAKGPSRKECTAGLDTRPSQCAWPTRMGRGRRRRGQPSSVFLVGERDDVALAVATLRVVPDSPHGARYKFAGQSARKVERHRRPCCLLNSTSLSPRHKHRRRLRELYILRGRPCPRLTMGDYVIASRVGCLCNTMGRPRRQTGFTGIAVEELI